MRPAGGARRRLPLLLGAMLAHNAEEGVAIVAAPGSLVHAVAASGLALPVPAPMTVVAGLVVISLVPAFVLLRTAARPNPAGLFLSSMLAAMALANALVPHLALTLVARSYTPGAVTALCLTLPVASATLACAWRERWIGRGALAGAIALGLVLLPLILTGFWALGELVREIAA